MKALLVQIFLFFLVAGSIDKVCAENIAVVLSSDASVYQEGLEGFREVVRHRIVSVQTLTENRAGSTDDLKKLRSTIEPDLIFVIGTSALQAVSKETTSIPIVYSMVFNPAVSSTPAGKNVTGIAMNPSAHQVYSLFKELNPKYRRIGVILDPARNGPLLSHARSAAQQDGLHLVTKEIQSANEIGAALKSLESEIDVLWIWPDERFLSDEILQRMFLFSFDRKIPALGLSQRHTDMGALVSLSYGSAKDMGRQAGDVANKLLSEKSYQVVSSVPPRHTKVTVNLITARKLRVEIPNDIVHRADNGIKAPIYKEGDWWVFRTKTNLEDGRILDNKHRVIFKTGRFESDDPTFLTGGNNAGTPSFLPFASVYFPDPSRKWLDFPLIAGKKWSFRYPRRAGIFRGSTSMWGYANAEVVGRMPQFVETSAGRFETIEINRIDSMNGTGHLTYFYSPETKSVVKLRAETATGLWIQDRRTSYELELIAYGSEPVDRKGSQ